MRARPPLWLEFLGTAEDEFSAWVEKSALTSNQQGDTTQHIVLVRTMDGFVLKTLLPAARMEMPMEWDELWTAARDLNIPLSAFGPDAAAFSVIFGS